MFITNVFDPIQTGLQFVICRTIEFKHKLEQKFYKVFVLIRIDIRNFGL